LARICSSAARRPGRGDPARRSGARCHARFQAQSDHRWRSSEVRWYRSSLRQHVGFGHAKWRGNWSNTLDVGKLSITGTAYYTGCYKGCAPDYAGVGCANAIGVTNLPGADGIPVSEQCHIKDFVEVDFVTSYKVSEGFTFYLNLINAFDAEAPFDPNTYGGVDYNPAFAQAGPVGRYFKAGANFKF